MKYLVIGGTRYMGRVVVQSLLERGDDVTVFSRGNTKPEWWDRVSHIQGDRADRAGFESKLSGKSFDAVIDTQAFKREDVESAADALRGNIGRYLLVSTGSVYLDGKLDFFTHCPFRESDVDWSSIDYTYPEGQDDYGVGKRHCEKWLTQNRPFPYTVIRIPAVMGWDDPTGRMWWWVQRALDGRGVIVPAENRAPFRSLYAADAAASFIRAVDAPAAADQIYHIATQEVLTVERWTQLIWQAAGHECDLSFIPTDVIRRSPGLETYAPPLTRPIPYIHDLSRSERDFGFQTTPVEQWVRTTVDWYRDRYSGEDAKGYEHRDEELALAAGWKERFGRFASGF